MDIDNLVHKAICIGEFFPSTPDREELWRDLPAPFAGCWDLGLKTMRA
ncbi:MAG: hypothetical protein M3N26_01250 [Pseudomonadota bacterium]|nr:hypothetical protein [Pseudomonadota bacterium]